MWKVIAGAQEGEEVELGRRTYFFRSLSNNTSAEFPLLGKKTAFVLFSAFYARRRVFNSPHALVFEIALFSSFLRVRLRSSAFMRSCSACSPTELGETNINGYTLFSSYLGEERR